VRIELTYKGFADLSLTTWVPRPLAERRLSTPSHCAGTYLPTSPSDDFRQTNVADFVCNSTIIFTDCVSIA
jgi:hypothetical protein